MNGMSFNGWRFESMKKYLLLGVSLAVCTPAMAQDDDRIVVSDPVPDALITVVATGIRQPITQSGQSISVVGPDEIASVQGPDLSRVLERLPGVSLTRNGGLGSFTGLRVRGANAEQVLVLVDGVRMADVAAPGGGADLGTLMAGGLGKVELLRGSNSVAWGSEAIGGVLALTSRSINGLEASAEYGARDSFDGGVTAGLAGDRYEATLTSGYTRSDGFSAAAAGSEPDGFRQWRLGGQGRVELAGGLWLTAVARHDDSRLDIDGFPPPSYTFADTPEWQETRQTSGRAGFAYNGDGLELDAGFALSDTRRDYFDPALGSAPNYGTRGRSHRAELRGTWSLAGPWRIDFGADREWARFSSTFDARKRARSSSAHALLGWHGEALDVTAGARLDDHSRYGSEVTLGANGALGLGGGWRLRASYGEGFKAPTLFQLFSDYGNQALQPERSRSYDAGIELGDRNGEGLHAALTAFRRDTRALIDYVSCFGVSTGICAGRPFGTYDNVGKARSEGFELELGARMSERLRAQAAYSYVKASDRTPGGFNRGNDLARRPRHAVSLAIDWDSPLAGLALGADIRMVSDSFDDAGNVSRIDGHALATLRASLPLTEAVEMFARIENVTDEDYQTAAGYGAPGRSAFVGARARF